MSRILVKGTYDKDNSYVLRTEDGVEYMRIRDGVPFRIDNQMQEWIPSMEVGRNGRPILVCRKGYESFALPDGKTGLWATTSGSARRGVFHRYNPPKNSLEAAVALHGGRSILHEVEEIDQVLEIGGRSCSHIQPASRWWYTAEYDGKEEQLSDPSIVKESSNQYHIGCYDSSWTERFNGGSYLIHMYVGAYMNGCRYCQLKGVWYTPEADKEKVAKLIEHMVTNF